MEYKKELEKAVELAQSAGELVMKYHDGHFDVETKNDGTPVTIADKKSNELILKGLRDAFPLDGVVSEELEKVEGKRTWYIDPIDGTKGFIRRNGDFAVHIGLVEDGRPVLGVVYRPLTKECYYGVKGVGAFKVNGNNVQELNVNGENNGLRLMVSYNYDDKEEARDLVALLNPSEIIKSGSEGLRLMRLVENKADLRITERPDMCSTWDLCAPHAVIEAAGGIVSFLDGNRVDYHGQGKIGKQYVAARSKEYLDYARKRLGYT
ncbi:3'(2'),5'-bisphosphate nucleotidase CysQ [archaeon]|nr:3'(2'),5'-bisphosphate nucleotidase CysQ [archaeon]